MNFYFTHGYDSKHHGGWTTVDAENADQAIALYRVFHPDKNPPYVDCSSIYNEKQFENTRMFRNGNFNKRCVERISANHMEIETEDEGI